MKQFLLGVLLVCGLTACCPKTAKTVSTSPVHIAFERNRQLGRGVNLGNALEAPSEGEWGVVIKKEYFQIMKDAGFDSVRIPVRWGAHAMETPPYTINKTFMDRVDWAVREALKQDLTVMLNIHNYRELYTEPEKHKHRFMALWKQLAAHYSDFPDTLYLEILNEPDDALDAAMWNEWLAEAHAIIRRQNPTKTIVIGSANDSWISYLDKLELPADRNIIVTVHHYFPLEFTHQGAEWVSWDDSSKWLGTTWTGTAEEKRAMRAMFDHAAAWSKAHNRPINLGEFGAYEKADMDSRARWTTYIAELAAERGFSLMYWEFCANEFGLYDRQSQQFRKPLLNAVIPPDQQ